MSGGCQIPPFAFRTSPHLESAWIVGPWVGRLLPSKARRERRGQRVTSFDSCTASSKHQPGAVAGSSQPGSAGPRAPATASPSAATRAKLSSAAHNPPGRVGKACRAPGAPDRELLLRAAEARRGAEAAQTPASASAGSWCCWEGDQPPPSPSPQLSRPGGAGKGADRCVLLGGTGPAAPPGAAPAAAAERGRRPPPRPPSPARAATKPSVSSGPRRKTAGRTRGSRAGGLSLVPGTHSLSGE